MGAASFAVFAKRDAFPAGLKERVVDKAYYGNCKVLEQAYQPWPDAETAMEHLADQDRYENGHMNPDNVGGKYGLVHIDTVDDTQAAKAIAYRLIQQGDDRILDKRGPAGCITIRNGDNAFMFFGFVAT